MTRYEPQLERYWAAEQVTVLTVSVCVCACECIGECACVLAVRTSCPGEWWSSCESCRWVDPSIARSQWTWRMQCDTWTQAPCAERTSRHTRRHTRRRTDIHTDRQTQQHMVYRRLWHPTIQLRENILMAWTEINVKHYSYWLIEWVVVLRLDTKQMISETFPQANLLTWYGKTTPNTTKTHIHQSKQMYCNTK